MFYVPKLLKSLDGFWLYRAVLSRLAALKNDRKLDIIDAHFGYPDGVGCVRAARALGIPVFITLRGLEEEYLKTTVIGDQISRALQQADGCICVSHSLKKLAIHAGASTAHTRVIHNAVDRQIFRPRDKAESRKVLSLAFDEPIIVSVGNLLSVKQHHVLITAFAELLETVASARLVIIGGSMHEPRYPTELRALCERLGVTDNVTFAGRLNSTTVASWLSAANVFALASKREGCCNAVLEALACGLPVVTTPVGDNTWFVKDGENGYIVPVDDSRAMAHALSAALERKDWDGDRICAGLQIGDWDRVAAEVLDFFAEYAGK